MKVSGIVVILLVAFFSFSCSKNETQNKSSFFSGGLQEAELPDLAEAIARLSGSAEETDPDREAFVEDFWRWLFGEAGIPERLARKVAASALESPAFIMELLEVLQQDPHIYCLVDKQHALPDAYEPDDLVPLTAGIYRLSGDGLMLRGIAAEALTEMAAAAAGEGIVLTVGSAYRSDAQHQLGLVLDFAPIDDTFAKTPASDWLLRNAGRFGWSLSYPDGYEETTGYRRESWHYRYVGRDLAAFIDTYFEGIQQYALQFIYAWQESAAGE